MPRCQRTFRRLPDAPKFASAGEACGWVCPWCADDRETYEPVVDRALLDYARFSQVQGTHDFGAPPDASRPMSFFLGLWPECVYEPVERRYEIYLKHGSDELQLRLQIGHEVFHRLCSRGKVFHWTHEMLACLQSVRLLEADGATAYADRMRRRYRDDAPRMSVADLLAIDLRLPAKHDPATLYGRAFALGEELREAAGWPALCRLARVGADGVPDVAGWLRSLDAATAASCARLMGDAR